MSFDCNTTYTGKLKYKDIDFTFIFTNEELRLIPPVDKESIIIHQWRMKAIGEGTYTFANPMPVDEKYIIADCNETKTRIIFLPREGSYLWFRHSVVFMQICAVVICKYNRASFDRISFSCPEINYIHPTNQAFTFNGMEDYLDEGIIALSTRGFKVTTTEKQSFTVDDKSIEMYFGISRNISKRINEPPLNLNSTMFFEFESTDDYSFVLRLHQIAVEFIRFLCYRKNIYISEIKLASPYKNGMHELFATMYILNQKDETEENTLKQGRYIKQLHIAGKEGIILSDIASGSVYLRHIPESYQSGRHIDAARFVMITAAFEWEFKRLYPKGVKKEDKRIVAENSVYEEIKKAIEGNTGIKKKIYKFLLRLVKSDSLQSEIIQIGKDFSGVIDVFGNHLYRLNNQELVYSEMGERLASQRNNYAHGNLDKDFIGLSLLDLMFLEIVVYAMQLRFYTLSDMEIQRSINELFHRGLALE